MKNQNQNARSKDLQRIRDFEKIICPGTQETMTRGGLDRKSNVYCKISFKSSKLSITGVVGPMINGDAHGSCGQIQDSLLDMTPGPDWDKLKIARFHDTWDAWHLNDMIPYSPEMKALGWHKLAKTPMLGYEFTSTMDSYRAKKAAEKAAIDSAKAGQTFTPNCAEIVALNSLSSCTLWVDERQAIPEAPDGMERSKHIGGHNGGDKKQPESKTLGWLYPKDHPQGLLGRKVNESDPYGYGCQWWKEEVPREVLAYLKALPRTRTEPAWI